VSKQLLKSIGEFKKDIYEDKVLHFIEAKLYAEKANDPTEAFWVGYQYALERMEAYLDLSGAVYRPPSKPRLKG
jgi:hypothetical protein